MIPHDAEKQRKEIQGWSNNHCHRTVAKHVTILSILVSAFQYECVKIYFTREFMLNTVVK